MHTQNIRIRSAFVAVCVDVYLENHQMDVKWEPSEIYLQILLLTEMQ